MKKILNYLRGAYVRSPPALRHFMAPLLSLIPAHLKYGGTYSAFRKDIVLSERDSDFVLSYRREKLSKLLASCVDKSVYYKATFNSLDISVDKIDVENEYWQQLPILTKDKVREITDNLLVCKAEKMDEVSTSGSSGKPLNFYLDKDRSVKEWAYVNHIWSHIGYNPDHKRAVLRGVLFSNVDKKPWEYDAALKELRLSPFHLTPDHMGDFLKLIDKYQIDFIHGYPSAIAILARYSRLIGWHFKKPLKGILTISETLYSFQRQEIEEAFDSKVMPFYGLSEKVAIAGEVVGQNDVYEFEPLYGITELLGHDDKPIIVPGKKGRIVSTGLLSIGMPLIRYDTGDEAELVSVASAKNYFRLRVKNIKSRWAQEFVVTKNSGLVSMTAINIHSKNYSSIQEFQLCQKIPGEVTIKAVAQEGSTHSAIEQFVTEIQEKVGSELILSLEIVDKIQRNNRGKVGFIDQHLEIEKHLRDHNAE